MNSNSPPLSEHSMASPEALLQSVFGYTAFKGRQQAVIESALAGRDSLVIMPTGGGKSLCYQIPAMLRPGTGLVVSPLIALMQDQVSALRLNGVRAHFLNSSQSSDEQRATLTALKAGDVDILYLAPERLSMGQTRELLASIEVSIVAIDEAHCVSQWGHDFRAEYLSLNQLRELLPGVPRMALTATATERSRREIIDRLELSEPDTHIGGFDRPNIRYRVEPKNDARAQLRRFLAGYPGQSGIVYCLSRKKS